MQIFVNAERKINQIIFKYIFMLFEISILKSKYSTTNHHE